ncbi:MAG: rhodanese-like domain-containing protein [Paracoccus sp. (in: a-proteobacteria)]|nr:rhodanese-like domain-containing protein [Paracoccus sp. (in: a-proteobacteria)]
MTETQPRRTKRIAIGYKQMLADAEAIVTSVSAAEIAERTDTENFLLVDIRDPRELERDGMIHGASHAPWGMLEFWIDPESPYHKPQFAEGKTYVFYCASGPLDRRQRGRQILAVGDERTA